MEKMMIVGTKEELDVIYEVLSDLKEKMPEILKEREAQKEQKDFEEVVNGVVEFFKEFADTFGPVISVIESEDEESEEYCECDCEDCDCEYECCGCHEEKCGEDDLRDIVADIDARLTHLIGELKLHGCIKR